MCNIYFNFIFFKLLGGSCKCFILSLAIRLTLSIFWCSLVTVLSKIYDDDDDDDDDDDPTFAAVRLQ